MGLDSKILLSFKNRSGIYDKKMEWVKDNELILPLFSKPFGEKQMLEICAGTGAVSVMFEDHGWNVVMLDSSKEMLQKTRRINSIIGDMHNLPFEDNSFDLIVCRQGLQYADLYKVFNEAYRVTKREFRIGHITRMEEDEFDFWDKYFMIASPGRKHIFNPGELENFAKENNFNLKSKTIITKQDNYIGPMMHLSNQMQKNLIDMLINTPDEFKRIYGVRVVDNNIIYNNRWEFITLEKIN